MGTSIPSSRKSQQSLIPTPHLLWVPTSPPPPAPVPWPYVTHVHHRCLKYVSAHRLARCVHGVNMRVQVRVLKLISVDTCQHVSESTGEPVFEFLREGCVYRHLCTGECVLRMHVCASLSAWTILCTCGHTCRWTYGPCLVQGYRCVSACHVRMRAL